MLTNEQNDRLTRIGPETPMGSLFGGIGTRWRQALNCMRSR